MSAALAARGGGVSRVLVIAGASLLTIGIVAAAILAAVMSQSNGTAMQTLPVMAYTGYRFTSPDPIVLQIRLLYAALGVVAVGGIAVIIGAVLRGGRRGVGAGSAS